MKTYHCDGGAFIEPPDYKFHDAYFSVVSKKGKLVHFEKNIGHVNNVEAETAAIQWVLDHRKPPFVITSDCQAARSRFGPLFLPSKVKIVYEHNNLADQWNARNHSPKYDRAYYIQRARITGKVYKSLKKFPKAVV